MMSLEPWHGRRHLLIMREIIEFMLQTSFHYNAPLSKSSFIKKFIEKLGQLLALKFTLKRFSVSFTSLFLRRFKLGTVFTRIDIKQESFNFSFYMILHVIF